MNTFFPVSPCQSVRGWRQHTLKQKTKGSTVRGSALCGYEQAREWGGASSTRERVMAPPRCRQRLEGLDHFAASGWESRVPRDIFPVNLKATRGLDVSANSLSRGVRRRLNKAATFECDALFTPQALNRCYLGSGPLLDHDTFDSKHKSNQLDSTDHHYSSHCYPLSAAQTQVFCTCFFICCFLRAASAP